MDARLGASRGLLWPAGEAWLRSTDALVLVGAAGVVLFLWLTATVRIWLQIVAMETAQQLANYNPANLEQWDRYCPGGAHVGLSLCVNARRQCDKRAQHDGARAEPNGSAFVATAIYAPSDLERRWDLARALRALPRRVDSLAPCHNPLTVG